MKKRGMMFTVIIALCFGMIGFSSEIKAAGKSLGISSDRTESETEAVLAYKLK